MEARKAVEFSYEISSSARQNWMNLSSIFISPAQCERLI